MATEICPQCKCDSFTWSIDEDESPLKNGDVPVVIIMHLKMNYYHWRKNVLNAVI